MSFSHIVTSFNGGEVDPLIEGRPDFIKYGNACRKLENFRCLPTGAAENRPGLQLIAEAKFADKKSILHEFQFSLETSFFLEFGEGYIRFYSNEAQILVPGGPDWASSTAYIINDLVKHSGNLYIARENHTAGSFTTDLAAGKWALIGIIGNPLEVASRFSSDTLFSIQKAQESDVMFFTDGIGRVQKLSRVTDIYWTLEDFVFKTPPLLDPNVTDITLTASGLTGQVNLAASADLFQAGHVGAFWQINHPRTDNTIELAISAANLTSANIPVKGDWSFSTTGTWSATVKIQRSTDGGLNYTDIRTFVVDSDRNIDTIGVEDSDRALYRLNVSGHTGGSGSAVFIVFDFTQRSIVEIVSVVDPQNVVVQTITDIGKLTATADWAEGAFSDVRGYPKAVTIHGSKLLFGGTDNEPQTVWGSRDDEFEEFELTTLSDGAIKFTPRTSIRLNIQWMVSQVILILGTSGGEITVGQRGESLTPGNINVNVETNYGSSTVPGLLLHEVIVFLQRQGRKLRELTFNEDKQGLDAIDRTIIAGQITEGGIIQMAFQQQPHGFLWGVTAEGVLVGMTFERDQDIWGWHRHITDGFFESIATDIGPEEDEVWVIVKRTDGNGVTKRFIEKFADRNFKNQEDAFFVDSGLSFRAPPKFQITGATQANPVVITATGINVVNDQQILIDETIKGMDELLGAVFSVRNVTPTTFELFDKENDGPVDGTNFVPYVSGGFARQVENTFGGLGHLEAKVVAVSCEGALSLEQTVENGQVTLQEFCSVVHIGLPYISKLIPMKLEYPGEFGTIQGKDKRISQLIIKVFKTLGLEAGEDEASAITLEFRKDTDPLDTAPPLITDDLQMTFPNDYNIGGDILLQQKCPLPCTILGIAPIIETGGPD